MVAETDSSREPRTLMSRDRVLRAAISLADEAGIESLTMRKLAHELGVEAMTLYYYVARKDDLLDGIVDLVVGEIEVPSGEGDWRPAIRKSAISAHQVLKRHPWACSLMMSPARVRAARTRYMESLLRRLREAGFSPGSTLLAYHALDSHILGFTLWLAGYSAGAKEFAASAATFLQELPADEYPYLMEHAREHMTESGDDDVDEFEFGLDLILDGLEKMRAAAEPS